MAKFQRIFLQFFTFYTIKTKASHFPFFHSLLSCSRVYRWYVCMCGVDDKSSIFVIKTYTLNLKCNLKLLGFFSPLHIHGHFTFYIHRENVIWIYVNVYVQIFTYKFSLCYISCNIFRISSFMFYLQFYCIWLVFYI